MTKRDALHYARFATRLAVWETHPAWLAGLEERYPGKFAITARQDRVARGAAFSAAVVAGLLF